MIEEKLIKKFEKNITLNENLSKYSWFNLGGPAEIFFKPSDEIIKSNEDLIIDNNENFLVLNKSAGISVQGVPKSK